MALTPEIQRLIEQARIVSFDTWSDHYPSEFIARFQVADDTKQYLNDDDLAWLGHEFPELMPSARYAQQLRDQAPELIDQARKTVLAQFPGITVPGGGLYPPARADACWRDFWHFLRCITYGIAAQRLDYTRLEGLQAMEALYEALQVPLDAMIVGLNALKTASLQQISPEVNSADSFAPYFDPLIQALRQFKTQI
jgi:Phycobilisome protein